MEDQITSLADLQTKKQNAIDAVEGRAGMTVDFMGAEENRISKGYDSQIAALGVQSNATALELQLLSGAYKDAKNTAAQIVDLATHDQQQQLADLDWSLNAYQDLYNMFSSEEKAVVSQTYNDLKDNLATAQKDETEKWDLIINASENGVNLNSLANSSLTKLLYVAYLSSLSDCSNITS